MLKNNKNLGANTLKPSYKSSIIRTARIRIPFFRFSARKRNMSASNRLVAITIERQRNAYAELKVKLVHIRNPLTVKRDCNRELARTWRMLSTSRFIHGVSWRNWISSILSRMTLTASENVFNGTKHSFCFDCLPDWRKHRKGFSWHLNSKRQITVT